MKTIPRVTLLLALVAGATAALAVTPPPDGGYPNDNTAEGEDALFSLTTGALNVAVGTDALYRNTTGGANVALGVESLKANTTGHDNLAAGYQSLYSNTSGFTNIAMGTQALYYNQNGIDNLAIGYAAMVGNTNGSANIGIGYEALFLNKSGSFNVGVGLSALYNNFTGNNNVAVGVQALCQLNGGKNNIALGTLAGESLISGDHNIIIGHDGVGVESGAIRIGMEGTQTKTYIAGILHSGLADGVAVGISATGQLGVRPGAARFQERVAPMGGASEELHALRPVTFRYGKAIDATGARQFGLVAEEVAKVDPTLVTCDEKGEPYAVRSEAVNAMLLNEFLKEHQKVGAQEKEIAALKATVSKLAAAVEKQSEQLQKVSAQVQTKQGAPRLVSTGE